MESKNQEGNPVTPGLAKDDRRVRMCTECELFL